MNYNITLENARQLGQLGNAEKARRKAELKKLLASIPANADEQARFNRVMLQIMRVDTLLETCDAEQFPSLVAAKERLWNLIYPKAGVLRPRQNRQSRPVPVATQVQPEPVVPQAPVAIPATTVQNANVSVSAAEQSKPSIDKPA